MRNRPKLQMSDVSEAGCPRTSSGAENSGLPSRGWMYEEAGFSCTASPKSVSLITGCEDACSTTMFSGCRNRSLELELFSIFEFKKKTEMAFFI